MASNEHHNEVRPIMDPTKNYEEINSYVIFWGLFFAALFALAVGYLCLKIGQTVDGVCTGINSIHGDGGFIQT